MWFRGATLCGWMLFFALGCEERGGALSVESAHTSVDLARQGSVGQSLPVPTLLPETQQAKAAAAEEVLTPVLAAAASEPTSGKLPQKEPRLELGETVYQFGVMSPHEVQSHRFELKNTGQGPLVISDAAANCKCVSHDLSHAKLLPGETGTLTLTWKGGDIERDKMTARIRLQTNDPQNEYVDLAAVGRVAREVSLLPAELIARNVTPGSEVTLSAVIGSSQWPAFSLAEVQPPQSAIRVTTEPLSAAEAKASGFESGYRLSVQVPSDLTGKSLEDVLSLVLRKPADGNQQAVERRLRLPLGWQLRPAIAVSGEGVDEQGDIHLTLAGGKPVRKRFLLKVNDKQPELKVAKVSAQPEGLQVSLSPYRVTSRGGLYRLEIAGPPSVARRNGPTQGRIRIDFDHPRITQYEVRIVLDASL